MAAKKRSKVPAKRGRPTLYSPEIAVRICAEMAEGKSLRSICEADDMPPASTVCTWLADNREGFAEHYTRAAQARALRWADEIVEIADGETDAQDRRVKIEARKWIVSKLLPRTFGDKVEHEHTGPQGGPLHVTVTHKVVDAGGG